MADGISVDMDTAAVVAALNRLGAAAQPFINAASKQSADAIATEARGRLRRQLGANATDRTASNVASRPARNGNGYVVVSEREPFPMLPVWLEKGTRRGAGTHANVARPYFYVSALLEESAHRRRIEEAVRDAIDAVGLGQ